MPTYNGTLGRDNISGDQNGIEDDTINGLGNADRLYGGYGTNTLNGGNGRDRIYSNGVRDNVDGGDGDDWVNVGYLSDTPALLGGTLEGGDGEADELYFYNAVIDSTSGSASFAGFESVHGLIDGVGDGCVIDLSGLTSPILSEMDGFAYNGYLYIDFFNSAVPQTVGATVIGGLEIDDIRGSFVDDNFDGGGGADRITGFGGADRLHGGDGNDSLFGNGTVIGGIAGRGVDGNDVLNGQAGDDTMAGDVGDDTYYVDAIGDVVIEAAGAGTGTDTVRASIDYALPDNVENLTLRGAGLIDGTGNALDNSLRGSATNNTLLGLAGADTIRGGGGRDTIQGGDGADLIDGGVGKDTLTGGADRDVFQFRDGDFGANRSLADLITDFSQTENEKIALNLVDADATVDGNQAFAWVGTGAFTGVAGQLRYAHQAGNTYVEGDTNGDGILDFAIALTGTLTLTAADFTL